MQVCVLWFLWSFAKGFSGATVSMQVPEGVGLKFCGGNKKMVKSAERMKLHLSQ